MEEVDDVKVAPRGVSVAVPNEDMVTVPLAEEEGAPGVLDTGGDTVNNGVPLPNPNDVTEGEGV